MRQASLTFAGGWLAIALSVAGGAQAADTDVSRAVRRALAAQGPVVTPIERAEVRALCGLPADAELRSLELERGVLICPDGRRVSNEQTHRLEADISSRAKVHARTAVEDPAVRAAITALADAKTRAALAPGDPAGRR